MSPPGWGSFSWAERGADLAGSLPILVFRQVAPAGELTVSSHPKCSSSGMTRSAFLPWEVGTRPCASLLEGVCSGQFKPTSNSDLFVTRRKVLP